MQCKCPCMHCKRHSVHCQQYLISHVITIILDSLACLSVTEAVSTITSTLLLDSSSKSKSSHNSGEQLWSKCFRENIGVILFCRHINDIQNRLLNQLPDKVHADINVLGTSKRAPFTCRPRNRRLVIGTNGNGFAHFQTRFLEYPTNPLRFLRSIGHRIVLRLASRQRNRCLLLASPYANCVTKLD